MWIEIFLIQDNNPLPIVEAREGLVLSLIHIWDVEGLLDSFAVEAREGLVD